HLVERPTRLDAHVDVEAALAGRLRPAPKPELVERLPDDASDLPYLRPPDARRRIEIDAQLVRMLEVLGTHGMRMKLEAREIREPDERSRIARHDLFGRSPGREAKLDDVDPVGTLLRGTLLIEECALDAVRIAYEHARASPCGVQRAVGDGQVVAHDVELRMPGRGKQLLARVRHGHLAACRYDQLRLGRSRHRGAPSDDVSPSASSRVPYLDREPYREAALAACVLERCPSDASRTRATSA